MRTIDIPIYGGQLTVTRSLAEFNRAYEKIMAGQGLECDDETPSRSLSGLTTHRIVDGEVVILTGVFVRHTAVRCHEAVHCAQALAETLGLNPIRETEAFAYLTQWFYEELGR